MVLIYAFVFSLTLLLGFMALVASHILTVNFIDIFSLYSSIISKVNPLMLFLSAILFSIFFAVVFYNLLRKDEKNILFLYPFLVFSVFLFVILGKNLFSFIVSLFSLPIAVIVYSSYFSKKENYKVVPYEKLVGGATKAYLTYLFLFISFLIAYYTYQNPILYRDAINDFMYRTTGIKMGEISALEEEMSKQQYLQTYRFAKNIEDYILYGIYTNIRLPPGDRERCLRAVNESMEAFDTELKNKLSNMEMNNAMRENLERVNNMFNLITHLYPIILFITIFFIFQVLTYIISIFAYLITSFLKAFY